MRKKISVVIPTYNEEASGFSVTGDHRGYGERPQ